ncbi:sickle [Glossina fuscipes fuscipes]
MAIPFCEPTAAQSEEVIEQILDQVDAAISTNNQNNFPTTSNATEEDLMAWKLLALIMCKVLKNLHQQEPAASNASSTNASTKVSANSQIPHNWQ